MSELREAREQAIHLLRLGHSPTEVGTELGRSAVWVRKCWRLYQAAGWAGLVEQSRAPKRHGTETAEVIQRAVVKARSELEAEAARGVGLKYIGGKAVRTYLKGKGIEPLPSVPTIERILREAGMTQAREKRPAVIYPRLRPQKPHQLCQADHIPRYLEGGEQVYCFNAIDPVSRFPTGQVLAHRRASDACAFLIHVWQTIGLAEYTQVDNEACFSGGFTHAYVLGQCVRLALLVGTELVFSPVRHPQSNGTVERFHQDYQRHVWEDTYLANLQAVQSRADRFFDLYRHSDHHAALKEETPTTAHQATTPSPLAATFTMPTGKLPVYAGRVHFIRRVQPDGTVSVLNVAWPVPNPNPLNGVWVTVELSPQAATLTIYDDAPDVPSRNCLVSYPFPLQQAVLPRPTTTATESNSLNPADSAVDSPLQPTNERPLIGPDSLTLWRWIPPDLFRPFAQPAKQLVRATLLRTANFVRNVAETMY